MTSVVLREYQRGAVEEVLRKLSGGRSVCLVAPTGAGKTAMAAALVQHFVGIGLRVLFVAHRIELVEQAIARLGVPCGVVVAGAPKFLGDMPCVVASLQTLARREMPVVDIVIVDEAHHVMSASYQRMIERAGTAKLIGLTATPTRLDGRPLGSVFEGSIEAAKVSQLIGAGFLVKPRVFTTPEVPLVDEIKKTAGDFQQDQLALACNTNTLRGDIVRHWRERCEGRPTVLFAVSIEHSKAIVADFAAAGIRAAHVDGTMARVARDEALQAVRTGHAKVLCNVGIVTEGWDFPELETCILARPTASLSLLLQMVGRIMRPHPNKREALVLDHAGNFVRHGTLPWIDIDWASKMEGKTGKKKLPAMTTCPSCFAIMLGKTKKCDQCGEIFVSAPAASRAEIEHDRTTVLAEVTSLVALAVDKYLTKRTRNGGEPLKPYVQDLIERIRNGKAKPDFTTYVLRANGVVGKAAYEYKQAMGRWP